MSMSPPQSLPALPFRVYIAQRLAAGESVGHIAHDFGWGVDRVRAILDPQTGNSPLALADVEDALHSRGRQLIDLAEADPTAIDARCRVADPSPAWWEKVSRTLGHHVSLADGQDGCELRALAVRAARREWKERPTEVCFCPTCSQATDVTQNRCEVCGHVVARPVVTFRPGWEGVDVADAADQVGRPLSTAELRDALRAHVRGGPGFRAAAATLHRRKYLASVLGRRDRSLYLLERALHRTGITDGSSRAAVKADPRLWDAERNRALTWLAKHPHTAPNVTEMPYNGKLEPEMVRRAASLRWDKGLGPTQVYRQIAGETGQNAEAVRKQIVRAFKQNGWPRNEADLNAIPRSVEECLLPSAPLLAWIGSLIGVYGCREQSARVLGMNRLQLDTLMARGTLDPNGPSGQLRGSVIKEILEAARQNMTGDEHRGLRIDVPALADLYEIREEHRAAV